MSTRAGSLENTPVSNWLAELRMECYKKNLENFETIHTLFDIKEIELKKLGIMNSRDRATMMGSLANYRAVRDNHGQQSSHDSKSLLRKGSLKKLNFKGLLGSSNAKKGKKKTENYTITTPAFIEQVQEVPTSPNTADHVPDYEELPEFSPFETKHFKVVTRQVVENEYVPSPQGSPRLDTFRSRSHTIGEFDMAPEVSPYMEQTIVIEEESPNMQMKHKHSSVISMESGLSFGFDIDKDFNPSFPLENQPWYHGRIPRAEAESLLHENGDFLVRENVTMPDTFTLSMFWNGSYDHTLISTTEVVNNNNARGVSVKYHFDGGAFDSIPELIYSHLRYLIPLDKDTQNVIMNPICRMGANKGPGGYTVHPSQDLSPTHYSCVTLPKNFGSRHKKRSSSPDYVHKHTVLQPVKSVSISPRSSPGRDHHVLKNSCSSSDILDGSPKEVVTQRNVISPTPQSEMRARAVTDSYGTHGRSRNAKHRLDSYGEDYEMMESVSILKTSPTRSRRNIPPAGNSSFSREPVQYAELRYHSNHSSPATASKRASGAVMYAEVRFRQSGAAPSPHPFSLYDTIPKAKVTSPYQSRAEILAQRLQMESNYDIPTPRHHQDQRQSQPHPFSHYATVQTFPRQNSAPPSAAQRSSYHPTTQTNMYTLPNRFSGNTKQMAESSAVKNRQSTASNESGHSSPGLVHSTKVLKGLPGYEALVNLHSLLGNYTNEELAYHLTKADAVCFLLTPRPGEDLTVWRERVQKVTSSSGVYSGLQTLADPDGEKMWKRLYFRHLNTSQLVSLCIVSAGDITERAKMLRRFIEIATLMQSGAFGNLFSFVSIMQGIAAPQVIGMVEVWDILEKHYPDAARSYKERQNIISNLCDGVSMFSTDQLSVPAIQHLKTAFYYEDQNMAGFAPPVVDRSLLGEYSSLLVGLDGIHTIVANCSKFCQNAWKRLGTHHYDATLMDFFIQDYTRTYLQHMGVYADSALERRRRFGVLLNALLDRVEALESL